MKKIILLTSFMLFTSFMNSQSSDIDILSSELCSKYAEEDLNLEEYELLQFIQKQAVLVNQENKELMNSLIENYKEKYPDKTDLDIQKEIGGRISFRTMETCPIFMKLSQKISNLNKNRDSKSVSIISNKVCEALNPYKETSSADLSKIAETIVLDFVFENQSLVEEEYGKTGLKEFYQDLNGELMAICDQFFKMAIERQRK